MPKSFAALSPLVKARFALVAEKSLAESGKGFYQLMFSNGLLLLNAHLVRSF